MKILGKFNYQFINKKYIFSFVGRVYCTNNYFEIYLEKTKKLDYKSRILRNRFQIKWKLFLLYKKSYKMLFQ